MNYVNYKASETRTIFSIKVSNKSIEQAGFLDAFEEQLLKREYSHRIMLEISNSAHIQNLQKITDFVQKFSEAGYKIGLDDFSPSPALLKYLQHMPISFVKVDGRYISKLLDSEKIQQQIEKLAHACKRRNVLTIAKHVEEQAQEDILKKLGIDYAQGFLYGKAAANPSFIPPSK